MRAYLQIFRLSISQTISYRLDFFLGRMRNIIVLGLLYYLWISLSGGRGYLSTFSHEALIAYVFIAHLLRPLIFGSQSRRIASDINDGTFSTYLLQPINPLLLFYFRELAERLILFVAAMVEVLIITTYLHLHILAPKISSIGVFLLSVLLAHVLYFLMSFCMSMLAFWSKEAMGPRFLFEWILEFASGAYFPLSLFQQGVSIFLQTLPFAGLMFVPLIIYLQIPGLSGTLTLILVQLFWIVVSTFFAKYLWKKGLARYSSEGI